MALTSLPAASLLALLGLVAASSATGPAEDSAPQTAAHAPPAKTSAMVKQSARKTWTAADLAKLSGRGVSVAGAGEPAAPGPGSEAGTVVAAQAPPDVADWASRAKADRAIIAAGEARMAAIDEIRAQWGAFIGATGGANQAMAAHELGRLREERKQWEDAVARARADLLHVEESARKAGVAPGLLR